MTKGENSWSCDRRIPPNHHPWDNSKSLIILGISGSDTIQRNNWLELSVKAIAPRYLWWSCYFAHALDQREARRMHGTCKNYCSWTLQLLLYGISVSRHSILRIWTGSHLAKWCCLEEIERHSYKVESYLLWKTGRTWYQCGENRKRPVMKLWTF